MSVFRLPPSEIACVEDDEAKLNTMQVKLCVYVRQASLTRTKGINVVKILHEPLRDLFAFLA